MQRIWRQTVIVAPQERPARLRSPVSRALVPVLGGMLFFVAVGLFTWGVAAYLSRGDSEPSELLAPRRLDLGSVTGRASDVAEEGPLLFSELSTISGERSLVVDHEGTDPATGWRLYYAFPPDRPDCPVTQVRGTATFIDCDGAELDVTELSPPTEDVRPVVEDQRILYLDLRAFSD
jgi:hypothetical protein